MLAAASGVPAQAQPTPASPEDDLKCAAWAAIVVGANKDNAEIANGLSMALAWFLARYEGATGKTFEQAMTAEYLEALGPQLQDVEKGCLSRVQEMGSRLSVWGQRLQEQAK